MAYELCQSMFKVLDDATKTYVADISTQCIAEITPVVIAGLTLWFMAYGLLIIRGVVDMPMTDFLAKSARIAIIVNIALAGGLYQSDITEFIRTLPDDVATKLVANSKEGATAASVIDEAASIGFGCAGKALDMAGLFSSDGLAYCMISLIILVMTIILAAAGMSFLLMSKLFLAVLAGLGPLFIVALVFPTTERFFNLWLAQIINYVLLVVLYAATFGFVMTIFKKYMEQTELDGVINVACTVGGVGILSIALLIVLRQLPSIASSLAGGAVLSFERGKRLDKAFGRGAAAVSYVGSVAHANLRRSPASSLPPSPSQGQASNSSSPLKHNYYKGNAMRAANTG